MSNWLPSFQKKYVIFIRTYSGDADHYDTSIFETDSEDHLEFVRHLLIEGAQKLDQDEYTVEAYERLLNICLEMYPDAIKELVFQKEPDRWFIEDAKANGVDPKVMQFREWYAYRLLPAPAEGYDYVVVDSVKVFKVNGTVEKISFN